MTQASSNAHSSTRNGPGRPRDPALVDRRRDEILGVATRLFAQRGYRGADLQDVADVLGVGKGTIYRYFPSKRELFQSAVDRVIDRMRDTIDEAVNVAVDPLDQISLAIRRYLQFFHDHPEYVEMLIQERAEFRDGQKPTYFRRREATLGRWHDLYRGLIREGRIRDVPVDRTTDVIGDLIYGAMFTNYIAARAKSLPEQADDIVDLVFNGLLTPAERERREHRPKERNQ